MLDPYIRDIQGIRLRNEYAKRYYCGRRYLFQFYLSAKGYYTYDKNTQFFSGFSKPATGIFC